MLVLRLRDHILEHDTDEARFSAKPEPKTVKLVQARLGLDWVSSP